MTPLDKFDRMIMPIRALGLGLSAYFAGHTGELDWAILAGIWFLIICLRMAR